MPLSPWTPHGTGLISDDGLYFGEECLRALLRGLNFSLAALRRFVLAFNEPLFEATMVLWDEAPGLGVLAAVQYHACNEIQRGAEGERRDLFLSIVDNALYLTMAHLVMFSDRGVLAGGFKDEIKKRVSTVVHRMRAAVPPPPDTSLVYCNELSAYLDSL